MRHTANIFAIHQSDAERMGDPQPWPVGTEEDVPVHTHGHNAAP